MRELDRTPMPFGKWGHVSHPSDHQVYEIAAWLGDRNIHPPENLLDALRYCQSGAEVIFALTFAPSISQIIVCENRQLAYRGERLEMQVPIPETRYTADFRWTNERGESRLVEVYGTSAHHGRRAADRTRHKRLTDIGYLIRYIPAEMLLGHPTMAWEILREEQKRT